MQEQVNYLAPVAEDSLESRSEFIWKCYAHVVGGILAFVAVEVYLFQAGIAQRIAAPMLGNWLMVLGGFMLVGWIASRAAHRAQSTPAQYAAFALFVVAEAIIFAPLLMVANYKAPGVIDTAAGITIMGSVALIATAMITRKDFSFLRGMLVFGGMLVLGFIVVSIVVGYQPGSWFSLAMIGFAGGAVLYDTSNIMFHYPKDKYVAAAMQLFASIALMFWYVLMFLMNRE